jgi:peptidoglycan hydrolase CwlO-like protein
MIAENFKKVFFVFLFLLGFFSFVFFFSNNFPNVVFSNDLQKKEAELEEKKKEKKEALSQLEKVKNEITQDTKWRIFLGSADSFNRSGIEEGGG